MATQKFVPVSEIDSKLLPKIQNYLPRYENGIFVGLGKTGKDSYIRGFVCDVEDDGTIVKVRYDALKKFDGLVGEDGHATPSAVMVVAESRADGIYLYCAPEYRVFIYDHVNNQLGVTVEGFAGGFTEKGKEPAETALEEVLQEHGIVVGAVWPIVRIGYASDNRAMTETCIEYYLGMFERQVGQDLQGDEVIQKTEAIRVDHFVPGLDGIVDTAYAFLVSHLKLVKPM
ncbi:MAG: hypothetical protein ABSC49_01830 [Candidatus Microgenomates bacterium]|jgi:8-oxo-dGTP pyrophosphatase MutT (NUDIX family)